MMALSEILFIALAVLTVHRPPQVPLRAYACPKSKAASGLIHYGLGIVTLLQFGCIPIADEIQHISGAFVVYILAGTWICCGAGL